MHLINILVQTDGLGSSALSTLERVPNVSSPLSLSILLPEIGEGINILVV